MARGKNPPQEPPRRGKEAANPNTAKGRTDNSKVTGRLSDADKDSILGKGDRPMAGSERWAKEKGLPPYDKG